MIYWLDILFASAWLFILLKLIENRDIIYNDIMFAIIIFALTICSFWFLVDARALKKKSRTKKGE